nr:hypothetical protein [Tanacetum cinerariifolium]
GHVFGITAVTYTSVYTDSEPGRVFWGADEDLSDGGSSRVIVYGYDGLPMLSVAPPSPDYVPSLEEPQIPPTPQDEDEHELMFMQPQVPDFVSEPIYPEYIPLEDEHILPTKEQPLPPVVSPTAESLEYVAELDPKEDLEEYEDDETEDGLVDYPMNGGDDGDDDDDDSSEDDAGHEDEDEEEEEENLALTDSAIAAISFPPKAEVERLLAMPTLSPSPLASLSLPSIGERLARCTAPDASPLPPPLHMPPPVDCRDDIPKTKMPPHKRLCLSTLGSRYEVRESSTARPTRDRGIDYGFVSTLDAEARRRRVGEVGYGIRETWVDPTETVSEMAPMTAMIDQALLQNSTNGNGSHSSHEDNRRNVQTARLCFYADFMKCQPFNFKGTEGVVSLTRWIEKMESVFQMSGCAVENQEVLKKKMTDKYCPQGEIKKLEIELWNLKVKENNVSAYTERFQELTLICTNGLPDNIYGSVKASKPKTLDETIELANDLMDQKLRTYAERQSNNKRMADDSFRNNHGHQQHTPKRQNVARVYNMGTGERKPYSEMDKDENINLVSEQGEVQEIAEHSRDGGDETLAETLLNIKRSLAKDSGKGIMQETELPKKLKKKEIIQLSLDEELAQNLYAKELAKEEERQEQERYNLEKALELQRQLDQRKEN